MSITISGGGGAPGITVETDPTALKLTGGTISSNSSTTALTVIQSGAGNVLELLDQTGDTTKFVVDSSGNVGINTDPATGSTVLNVGGWARANYFNAINNFLVNGVDIKAHIFQTLFGGGEVFTTTNDLVGNIYYIDGSSNVFESGQNDWQGNGIDYPVIGTITNGYGFDKPTLAFVQVSSQSSYSSPGTPLLQFESSTGTVYVESDGNGGLQYNPPSF